MSDVRLPALLQAFPDIGDLKIELTRKSLHFLIALSPLLAYADRAAAIALLLAGTACYAAAEALRLQGVRVPLVSALTEAASRERDAGGFVRGPVTLGLGAAATLFFFPAAAAATAIFALAFGDGFASLVGRFAGRTKPAFLSGKSLEGSTACFCAAFLSALAVTRQVPVSIAAALTAAAVEALPLGDYDNVAIPFAVALIVALFPFR